MGLCQMDCPTSNFIPAKPMQSSMQTLAGQIHGPSKYGNGDEKKLVLKVQFQFQHSNLEEQVSSTFRLSSPHVFLLSQRWAIIVM